MLNIKMNQDMKTRNSIYRQWALLLMLLIGLPLGIKAQTNLFEMVVEKTDATELTFRITDDYPVLQYQYGGEDGVNTIKIQTEGNYTSVPCPDIKRLYTREYKPIPGDVTGSGSVDVQDATIVINYILGDASGNYNYTNADMNNDGEVDVFDVTAMINVILSGGNSNSPSRRSNRNGNDCESICLTSEGGDLLFGIDNTERFTSFQFNINVPQGVELLGVEWNAPVSDHILQFSKNGENCYTLVALSMSSLPLPVLDAKLLKLHLSDTGNGEVSFNNILFVTPRGEAICFEGGSPHMTTGVKGVTYTQGELVRDISGRQINMKREQLPKGVYVINNKKVVIK
jgi:hypothetical protein